MADRSSYQDPTYDPFDPQDERARQNPERDREDRERERRRDDDTQPLLPEDDHAGFDDPRDAAGYR
ncbi:hypothetical protein [Streptomyces sp. NPDC049813]|uniref:hypothetical protein n=1 Tax=Streptomyces sp. NPDC049813 TaxID=3365597 RepID=UPI00379D4714